MGDSLRIRQSGEGRDQYARKRERRRALYGADSVHGLAELHELVRAGDVAELLQHVTRDDQRLRRSFVGPLLGDEAEEIQSELVKLYEDVQVLQAIEPEMVLTQQEEADLRNLVKVVLPKHIKRLEGFLQSDVFREFNSLQALDQYLEGGFVQKTELLEAYFGLSEEQQLAFIPKLTDLCFGLAESLRVYHLKIGQFPVAEPQQGIRMRLKQVLGIPTTSLGEAEQSFRKACHRIVVHLVQLTKRLSRDIPSSPDAAHAAGLTQLRLQLLETFSQLRNMVVAFRHLNGRFQENQGRRLTEGKMGMGSYFASYHQANREFHRLRRALSAP